MAKRKPKLSRNRSELGWTLIAAAAAVVAGLAARKALDAGWRASRKAPPPENPAMPDTTWTEALAWTAATSLVVGLARLLAQRGAAVGWRRATGRLPPNV